MASRLGLKPSIKASLASTCCALAVALTPIPASATAASDLKSANERINSSGKLRMLSQRMAAAGCNLNAGVQAEQNVKVLTNAKVEFKQILGGLRLGDGDLRIEGAEADAGILADLGTTQDVFAPIEDAVLQLIQDPNSGQSMDQINATNMALLGASKSLVQTIVGVYADPDEGDGLGATIDVAGRQRMLTQKMSKEACQIWSGAGDVTTALAGTMELFESSLNDLQNGANDMVAPPSDDVARGLDGISTHWQKVKPALASAAAGQSASLESRGALQSELDALLREMNRVVGLYVIAKQKTGRIDDIGATERVNFSGKLRMLSQRVAAAACNYAAGVESEDSLAVLLGARSEFEKIAKGLEFGDADLRIKGEEKRSKTRDALKALNEEWAGMSVAIDAVVQGEDVEGGLEFITTHNMELLGRAKLLVSEISGQYSNPAEMVQADAMLIDISGRQRMLTQKMSKESCLVWSGNADSAEALQGTMKLFETSLLALRDGLDTVGIKAAPTEDIFAGLDDIWGDWQGLKPELERAVANESADPKLRAQVFADLNVMLKEMNAVVGLYTIYGKTGI